MRNYFINALSYAGHQLEKLPWQWKVFPSTINQYTATNQVVPRNLPGKVNEYGFDVGFHGSRAWWVVKTNDVDMPKYELEELFSTIGNEPNSFLEEWSILVVIITATQLTYLHCYWWQAKRVLGL